MQSSKAAGEAGIISMPQLVRDSSSSSCWLLLQGWEGTCETPPSSSFPGDILFISLISGASLLLPRRNVSTQRKLFHKVFGALDVRSNLDSPAFPLVWSDYHRGDASHWTVSVDYRISRPCGLWSGESMLHSEPWILRLINRTLLLHCNYYVFLS